MNRNTPKVEYNISFSPVCAKKNEGGGLFALGLRFGVPAVTVTRLRGNFTLLPQTLTRLFHKKLFVKAPHCITLNLTEGRAESHVKILPKPQYHYPENYNFRGKL
jgi:hypothetical protein